MEKEVTSGAILGIIFVCGVTILGLALHIAYFVLFVLCALNVTNALALGTGYAFMLKYALGLSGIAIILYLLKCSLRKGLLVYVCDLFIMLTCGCMGAITYKLFYNFENMLFIFLLFCGVFVILLFKARAEIKKNNE